MSDDLSGSKFVTMNTFLLYSEILLIYSKLWQSDSPIVFRVKFIQILILVQYVVLAIVSSYKPVFKIALETT